MTDTFFKLMPLDAREAAGLGYEQLSVDLGDPALDFSTTARRRSLVLRRAAVADVLPAGVLTIATVYVPETREAFHTSVDVYAFDHPIEAQPCADHALISRGYDPIPENAQRGLFVGGSVGILSRDGRKVRGARSHSVVRGRRVVTIVCEFPIDDSPRALVESGAIIANLAFADGRPPAFEEGDVKRVTIPIEPRPLALAYPGNWSITANGFEQGTPPGTVLFAVGEAQSPKGLMTFGVRRDAAPAGGEGFEAWATRIAELYVAENKTVLAAPRIVAHGSLKALASASATGAFYVFHLDNLRFHRRNQIRVVVMAAGDRRYTLSLLTDVSRFEDIGHFLVYATGVTGHELMVDSALRAVAGRGIDGEALH